MAVLAPTPDHLLCAARAGDEEALGELLRRHRRGIYRYGLQVCRTTEDAEDAVQETLWAATRAIRTFRGSASSVVSWMFTIVRRECHRLHRKDRFALTLTDDDERIAVGDTETVVAERRRTFALGRALGSLDPVHREVVLLRDVQGLSAPEAAELLGISVEALKSRLHRARAKLRELVLESN